MKPNFLCLCVLVLPWANGATVTNGSFEDNRTDGGSTYQPLYAGFDGLPGWRFSPAPAPVLIGTPDENYAYKTPFGRWQLDLSGSDNTTGGWIETDVTGLAAGSDYRLTFSIGTSTGFLAGGGPPSVTVSVGGTSVSLSAPPTGIIEWLPQSVNFRASADTMSVRFLNTSPAGTGLVSIDAVAVNPIAAPPRVTLTPLPDGQLRLDFEGVLESSADLIGWNPSDLTSGSLVSPGPGAGFFRAEAR